METKAITAPFPYALVSGGLTARSLRCNGLNGIISRLSLRLSGDSTTTGCNKPLPHLSSNINHVALHMLLIAAVHRLIPTINS